MTRYEKQERIYRDIQSVEAELNGCPHGSSRWFELHDRLHALLQEYVAVPQDPPAVRTNGSRQDFRKTSYELRGPLWLTVVGLLIGLPMMPLLSHDLPWMVPFWCVMLAVDLLWAIWASSCPQR